MKQRLGLPQGEKIPAPVQNLVDSAARDAAENTIEIAVIREVEKATTRLARATPSASSQSPTTASDVSLLQDAEELAARKKALEAAGFSGDEAMRILIAEVTAGHRHTRGP
jgi:hypothetical protein